MGTYKVTDLKQGVKNSNRVNVIIEGNFAFSLDLAQVVDFKLKVGKELSDQDLEELKKASEFGKLYQRTLEWVLMRPRSRKEVQDYLSRKLRQSSSETLFRTRRSFGPSASQGAVRYEAQSFSSLPVGRENSSEDRAKLSQAILERLSTRGYLDDRVFAKYYVENRFVKKGISQKRLTMELMKKGVAKEVVDEVLGVRNDEEEILKIIAKKRSKYNDEKLTQYLCRQGFDYQLVRNLVSGYGKD